VDNDIDELNYCTYLWIKNCFIIITMLRQLIIVWEVRRSVNNGCIQSDSSISELMETRSNLDDVIACWMHTVLPERACNEVHCPNKCRIWGGTSSMLILLMSEASALSVRKVWCDREVKWGPTATSGGLEQGHKDSVHWDIFSADKYDGVGNDTSHSIVIMMLRKKYNVSSLSNTKCPVYIFLRLTVSLVMRLRRKSSVFRKYA